MKKIDILVVIIYLVNVLFCIFMKNWLGATGWATAFLIQLRVMKLINID
jgi:hypothetical protein